MNTTFHRGRNLDGINILLRKSTRMNLYNILIPLQSVTAVWHMTNQ
jgi:hypothetical protein